MAMETAITADTSAPAPHLPTQFVAWFTERGWQPRAHQLDLLARAQAGQSTLLIAPTGAGKTLAGFLPALTDLARRPKRKPGEAHRGIHTLYISPLKALATDIKRNLETPVEQMALPIRIETRTGDTPAHRRQRQKLNPPDILMTTPEQLALLIAQKDADRFFADLRYVIFDELHSLVTNKRGHMLALGLARLRLLRPAVQTIGLSATVSEPLDLQRWLVAQNRGDADASHAAGLIQVSSGVKPDITILDTQERLPWSGHTGKHARDDVYRLIKEHKLTLIFVNTRSQAENIFQQLWHINEDTLPIALHHGSLEVGQRRKVEAAMADNRLRAVIATSTLDLGIDWGDVDLVIHLGCTEGGEPAGAAHRALQPPHGRAVQGRAGADEPVRGAGMQGGARRQLSRRPGHAPHARRGAGRARASTFWAWRWRGRFRRMICTRRSSPLHPMRNSTGTRSNAPSSSWPPAAMR